MPRRRVFVLLISALAVALAALAPIAIATHAPYGDAAANKRAAETAAAQLLSLIQLPPGTSSAPSGPSGQGQPAYDEATPNLVDAHAWWTSAESPATILAYVKAHLPAAATPSGDESSSGPGQPTTSAEFWALPAVPGSLAQRILALSLIPSAGGGTTVRTDGEAVWLTPRPSWERIPSGVREVTFVDHGAVPSGRPGPASAPGTLRGARARRLVTLVNRLPVVQPGAFSCPAGFAEYVALRFIGPSGRILARATENSTGCASVALTLGSRHGPGLQDYPSVTDDLIRLGGIPVCRAGALTAGIGRPGRDGPPDARAAEVRVVNRSNAVCRLRGFPSDVGLDGAGGPLPARVHDEGARAFRHEGIVGDVVLGRDSSASFLLAWRSCDATPAQSVSFSLPSVPGGRYVVAASGTIAPCRGRLGVGSLSPLP